MPTDPLTEAIRMAWVHAAWDNKNEFPHISAMPGVAAAAVRAWLRAERWRCVRLHDSGRWLPIGPILYTITDELDLGG